MKWAVTVMFLAGLASIAVAAREATLGGDNPTGDQWERRQAAPLGWIFGLGLIVAATVITGIYVDIKVLFG